MKYLSINLQTERDASTSKEDALAVLSTAGLSPEVFVDDVYVNLKIKSDNLNDLWQRVQSSLISLQQYANACVVICEGEDGWNDYLLLHHYDESEKLDTI